jgi:hypothetical protein
MLRISTEKSHRGTSDKHGKQYPGHGHLSRFRCCSGMHSPRQRWWLSMHTCVCSHVVRASTGRPPGVGTLLMPWMSGAMLG